MNELQVALYARVSSEQQAEAKTIESQLAEIRARVAADGFALSSILEFIDEGYSGSTLVRPALERLRDVAAAGGIDRLYVHCPDRFARNYASASSPGRGTNWARCRGDFSQSATWADCRGSVIVAGPRREGPRTSGPAFLERSRRGKRHAAQEGRIGILCHAPYGYRYVNKQEGGGEARFDIVFDEARLVRQVFTWVGQERCTINEVCRRLHQAGVQTRTGKEYWDHKTVWDMLKNPAYKGEAAFGKTHWVPNGPRLRVPRGKPAQPRRAFWGKDARHARSGSPSPCLPSSIRLCLMPCKNSSKRTGDVRVSHRKAVAIFCRVGFSVRNAGMLIMDVPMTSAMPTTAVVAPCACPASVANGDVGTKSCVWTRQMQRSERRVCHLLEEPERLEQEYRQRLQAPQKAQEPEGLDAQMGKLRRGIARLIDSYAEGFIGATRGRLCRVEQGLPA